MKRILFSVAVLGFSVLAPLNGSAGNPVHDQDGACYRTSGYSGNLSFTNKYFVWIGLDTSHGYMFNPHHYLGAGAGLFAAPVSGFPVFAHAYADYRAYLLKKNSTPVTGLKAGYCIALKELTGNAFSGAFEFSPDIGWSWSFSRKTGLALGLGASVFIYPAGSASSLSVKAMPELSVRMEFR